MGANIFNMGIIGTLGGFAIYLADRKALGGEERGRLPAAGIAAWLSVMVAALRDVDRADRQRHHRRRRSC